MTIVASFYNDKSNSVSSQLSMSGEQSIVAIAATSSANVVCSEQKWWFHINCIQISVYNYNRSLMMSFVVGWIVN